MKKDIELKNLLERINKLLQSNTVPESKKQELIEDKRLIENLGKERRQVNEEYDRKIRVIESALEYNLTLIKDKINNLKNERCTKKLKKERRREKRQDKTRYIG
jgi:hypothetical protein